jgi:hypothetical protein
MMKLDLPSTPNDQIILSHLYIYMPETPFHAMQVLSNERLRRPELLIVLEVKDDTEPVKVSA